MSVLIKGMEMPKYKGEHKDFDRYGCFLTVYKNGEVELHVFENNYTVEEIPTPHGRLIDADKLQTAIHGCLCENCQTFPCEKGIGCLIEDVFNLLDEAPTIIESEVTE